MDSYLKCIYKNSLDFKDEQNPDSFDYKTVMKFGLNHTSYIYENA